MYLSWLLIAQFSSVSSVTQSCPTLCDPMNCSTPGLPVHHQLPEFTQTHIHRVSDAIQPSHRLLSPSPPAPNPSQHQSLFQWVNSSPEYWSMFLRWPKYWSFSFSIIPSKERLGPSPLEWTDWICLHNLLNFVYICIPYKLLHNLIFSLPRTFTFIFFRKILILPCLKSLLRWIKIKINNLIPDQKESCSVRNICVEIHLWEK